MKYLILASLILVSGCGSSVVPSINSQEDKVSSLTVNSSTIQDAFNLYGSPPDETGSSYDGVAARNPNLEYVVYHFNGGNLKLSFKWTCTDTSGNCICSTAGETVPVPPGPPYVCRSEDVGKYLGHKKSEFYFSGSEVY